jgi:hypothetical protein
MVVWCVRVTRRLKRHESPNWSTLVRGELAFVAAGLTIVLIAGLFVDYLKAEVTIWLLALLAVLQSLAAQKASAAVAAQQPQLMAAPPDKRHLSTARRS